MSMAEIVSLNLTRATVFPTRAGFGVPLLVAFHTATANMIDFYTDMTGVVADHAIASVPYKMAAKAFAQNPRPSRIAIGRRLVGSTQVVTLEVLLTTAGLHYAFTYKDYLGASVAVDYTVPGGATPTSIAAAIVAILTATPVGATCANVAGVITITSSTPGRFFDLIGLPPILQLKVKNTTADPGIATDLTAISAVDSTTWYGIALDSNSKAEILAAAAWVEATRKFLYVNTSDSEVADNAVTTDVASSLVAAAYARTGIMFSAYSLLSFRALGLMSKMFTTIPGSATWEYQTINGDTVDSAASITSGSLIKIKAKNCAVYIVEGGVNSTENVKIADSEPVDLIPGTDKLFADIQTDVFTALKLASDAGSKIPYTDDGVETIKGVISARLTSAVGEGFLAENPGPVVTAPKVASIDPSVRASRNLPGVVFSANLSGAIHTVTVKGTLAA